MEEMMERGQIDGQANAPLTDQLHSHTSAGMNALIEKARQEGYETVGSVRVFPMKDHTDYFQHIQKAKTFTVSKVAAQMRAAYIEARFDAAEANGCHPENESVREEWRREFAEIAAGRYPDGRA